MKNRLSVIALILVLASAVVAGALNVVAHAGSSQTVTTPVPTSALRDLGPARTITEADCTTSRLGAPIPASAIGEPVSGVTLAEPRWVAATDSAPAYCSIDGAMTPADQSSGNTPAINFRVLLPASWSHRAIQLGGGGMNGTIPNLTGQFTIAGRSLLSLGFATFGSDSGHQSAFGLRGRGAPAASSTRWAYSDEAIRNFGYAQMKKTRDAAMVVIERAYGARPRFTYYAGTSQGGREALTVAQRYPADYDGVVANVPVVNFSSLMLAPELIRIQEKPIANWVTPAKAEAIRAEFMRQCDGLDGLADGVMNNYAACRAIFDVTQGAPGRRPWAAKRCPNNVDPNPADTSASACLTDGQIATLEFVYRRYGFAALLANGVSSFGMWLPNTDPSGSGLILPTRFRGQEGAAADAPMHTHLGVLGVTGFLMRDVEANPLDYVEGGPLGARRMELSRWLDSTDPDLTPFAKRGGRMIVTIGTNDTLASPGAQLDYYQSVIDRMGRAAVDGFARFFVIPQAGHGLSGTSATVDGNGRAIPATRIPNTYDRLGVLVDWVENGRAPALSLTVTADDRSLPLCSYPTYPRYQGGPTGTAASYACGN
jgi:feruloyl esterase